MASVVHTLMHEGPVGNFEQRLHFCAMVRPFFSCKEECAIGAYPHTRATSHTGIFIQTNEIIHLLNDPVRTYRHTRSILAVHALKRCGFAFVFDDTIARDEAFAVA